MLKLFVKAQCLIKNLKDNKEGATIIEYSLLIGLLTIAVVAAVLAVGPWLQSAWTQLCTALNAATGLSCTIV